MYKSNGREGSMTKSGVGEESRVYKSTVREGNIYKCAGGEGIVYKSGVREGSVNKSTVRESCVYKSTVREGSVYKTTVREDCVYKSTVRGGSVYKSIVRGEGGKVREKIKLWQDQIINARDERTRIVIEDMSNGNKHKFDQKLQQQKNSERMNNECDAFRNMPRVITTDVRRTKSIKRLQEGPARKAVKLSIQKQTGKALGRLISGLIEAHPEAKTGYEGRKYARGKEEDMKTTFEDCLALIDNLTMVDEKDDLPNRLGGLRVRERKLTEIEVSEELSYWEDLGALEEEDFKEGTTSNDNLKAAEEKLMEDFMKNIATKKSEGDTKDETPTKTPKEADTTEKTTSKTPKEADTQETPIKILQEESTRKTPATPATKPDHSKTPTPPPSKRRKMKTPTMKTKSSKSPKMMKTTKLTPGGSGRHTPITKKTPALHPADPSRDTTETRQEPLTMYQRVLEEEEEGIRNFTIGHSQEDEASNIGKVRRMRQELEKKIRQGKRWEAVEDTRKRILTPAKAKRTRGEDGEWESIISLTADQPDTLYQPAAHARGQAMLEDTKKRIQTPIRSFLVSQTPEERQASLQIPQKPKNEKKMKECVKKAERSALPGASPSLRRRIPRKTEAGGYRKYDDTIHQEPRKMSTILDSIQKPRGLSKDKICEVKPNNNNQSCNMPGTQPSTRSGHERETQHEESSQPITAKTPDHVTSRSGLAPMGDRIETRGEKSGKSSHLGQRILPEHFGE